MILTGQSNFTGTKLDLELLRGCHERGFDTFLDAAALAPTTPISLSALNNAVEAIGISVYKMIGYPTGVGALILRNDLLEKLKRPWFSGGDHCYPTHIHDFYDFTEMLLPRYC